MSDEMVNKFKTGKTFTIRQNKFEILHVQFDTGKIRLLNLTNQSEMVIDCEILNKLPITME